MLSTSLSLLERLRQPGEALAWDRFVALYAPLLFAWGRRLGLPRDEVGDLVQDVLVILVQRLPEFTHDRRHSFRAWLKTILLNRWRNQSARSRPGPLRPEVEPAVPD